MAARLNIDSLQAAIDADLANNMNSEVSNTYVISTIVNSAWR